MTQNKMWHEPTLHDLATLLNKDSAVRALVAIGTCALQGHADAWSDLDAVLVLESAALGRYYPSPDWLSPIGQVFAVDHAEGKHWSTLRVCLTDLRRIDLLMTTEQDLSEISVWPWNPFANGRRILFSRSTALDAALAQPARPAAPPDYSPDQFQSLANQFWFKGTLAVTKIARNDLLVGLHLALDMVRDCTVLAMALRDRAAGTAHHRVGGAYNHVVALLDTSCQPHNAEGILNIIKQSVTLFEQLSAEWSESYVPKGKTLLDLISCARDQVVAG